jgi:hypothetical protein
VDLSPGQQKAVFALVVVVLAALGYWLVLPKVSHSSAQAHPARTPSPTESVPSPPPTSAANSPGANSSGANSSGANSSGANSSGGSAGAATPAATGSVNIYSWLPFTQQGLTAAATVTQEFLADYDTYSYTESARAYVGKMGGLITGQLSTTLQDLYASPGVAKLRNDQQQVATATAVINSLRSFGTSSLTFIATATQHLATAKGSSNGSTRYAITVTGSGTSWQVNDIELSSAGQF